MIRRPVLVSTWVLELWLALVAALLAALWLWSGSEGSLATALQLASRTMPPGHRLLTEDARGSLRTGGRIARLRWDNQGLSVEAQRIELRWNLWALLERRVVLERLQIADLTIDDQRPARADTPPDLRLPLQFDAPFSVDRLHWVGPPGLRAQALAGHYRYDGMRHALTLDSVQIAQGRYQGRGTLLASAPLTLDLQARGQVQVLLDTRPITLNATATLQGPLGAAQDVLQLVADLQPGAGRAGVPVSAQSMRAHVTARIRPRSQQPVQDAQARFSQLDLAALWPDAPRTLLTGDAQVVPRGALWQASLRLTNGLPGPWDKHLLPVQQARAVVGWAAGSWNIESLRAEGAGGTADVQGRVDPAGKTTGWQARAQLAAINPALLHSQLAPARISGTVQANSDGQRTEFTAALQPAGTQPTASPLAGLRLQQLSTRGSWGDGWLRLPELLLQTDDASVRGSLELQPASRSGRAQLQLALPGAQGRVDGQLAALDGSGDVALDVSDAGRLSVWLRRQPQWPREWALPAMQGRADLALQWQGGWQALQTRSSTQPNVQALLRIPTLAIHPSAQDSTNELRVQGARIELTGPPGALALAFSGDLSLGLRRFSLQAQAQGGRAAAGDWRMGLQALKVDLRDAPRPGLWSLGLGAPVVVEWLAGAAGGSLRTGPAQAQLTGPLPGAATLQLQPISWTPGVRGSLSSRGELLNLPMDWLTLLANTQLATLGLSGNLVFDATWDLAAADTLQLRATLARRSGDIRVLADALPGSQEAGLAVDAGVRDARLTLVVDGEAVTATARWDSERAGNAQADIQTRLAPIVQGWDWPAAAPLSGNLRARLPQVGVWSVLAPPGWRMRGTLDANLSVTGSRQAPQWTGQLLADDLALRSVVDGIEFGNGRLRARMQGQRLAIEEFSLQGAGGSAGGTLDASGFALWLPAGAENTGILPRIQIDLDATARGLRVSGRADRRMVVSGTVQARLRNARLDVQGALKADQASFVLPDETAPQLGDDVVIRGSKGATAAPTATANRPSTHAPPGTTVRTTIALALDLGPDFRVQGRGIVTRLAGTLQLRAQGGEPPRLIGEVRTVLGSYKAYGQLLDIEQGVMRFTGAYDNPVLDILALRPNLTQRVGVQITGTAFAPRVRLFAEPELPEAEKLAWLVLGRSGANGGAEAAVLQQAALALLGRNGQGLSGGLAGALGLDELSLAAASSRSDGSTSAATVTLGKRISRDFYVAYERSLAGTLGTISIFYDLSRRFTLRASTGEQSAIDLIFTIRYD